MSRVMYRVGAKLCSVLLRVCFRFRVYRRDALEALREGAVVVCNHVGWIDVLAVDVACHPRQVRYLAKRELFETALGRWLFAKLRVIPINRDAPELSSIRAAASAARNGALVAVFPSGTRSELAESRRGAITIAKAAGVGIISAAYEGPSTIRPSVVFRRSPAVVCFGRYSPHEVVASLQKSTAPIELDDRLTEARVLLEQLVKGTAL